jgi:hypothetical protein
MNMLKKLWWGLYPLPVTFWVFYACGFFVLVILSGLLLFLLSGLHLRTIGLIIGLCVIWSYMAIATVGVWRSAGVRIASPIWMDRFWGITARGLIGLYTIVFLWRLINGGALSIMGMFTGPLDF